VRWAGLFVVARTDDVTEMPFWGRIDWSPGNTGATWRILLIDLGLGDAG